MKKRKLNSKNPKYNIDLVKDNKEVLKRVHMCDAVVRNSEKKDTGRKAAVYGVWYK